jgi:hypothetical protein
LSKIYAIVEVDGNYEGVINLKNEWVLEPNFKKIEIMDIADGRIRFFAIKDGEAGILDINGDWSPWKDLNDVEVFTRGLAKSSKTGKWGFVDPKGLWEVSPEFDDIIGFFDGGGLAKFEDKWGFINKRGEWMVAPVFDDFGFTSPNLFLGKRDGKWGVLTIDKDVCWHSINSLIYDETDECVGFNVGDMIVPRKQEEKWGYSRITADRVRVWYIRPMFEIARNANEESIAAVKYDNKWGFIDIESKNWIIPPKFDDVYNFKGEFARAKNGGKWGFIDKKGEWVVRPNFDELSNFSNELAGAKINGKWGFIDLLGIFIIDPMFDEINPFLDSLTSVKKSGKWGFIDQNGDVVISHVLEDVKPFSDGLAAVKNETDWGFINSIGTFVIPFYFDEVGKFSGGMARAKKEGKWGIIGILGEWVIPPDFDYIWGSFDEFSIALRDDKIGVIYKEGEDKYNFKPMESLTDDWLSIGDGNEFGVDAENTFFGVITESEEKVDIYREINKAKKGLKVVKNEEYFGIMDNEGKLIISPQYHRIELIN